MQRRTKIVATIGPASNTPEMLVKLISAGVDVVRLNFSHGEQSEHAEVIKSVREISQRLARPIAILQDLQGPKIRIAALQKTKDRAVQLIAGKKFTITTREVEGDERRVSTTYKELAADVKPGDRILLDDGMMELRVDSTSDTDVECAVIFGGLLKEHKGINLPGVDVSAPSLTEKDIADLDFGVKQGVDFIALSFVRRGADVEEAKRRVQELGQNTPVIAKIEKPEAVENLDSILVVSDGVMVARGDLGVELPVERVPIIQKEIIAKAAQIDAAVITATQMLESMTAHPRPTRAEASDVANAIFDGADAVMLSGETAAGKFPVETVETMARIISQAEESFQRYGRQISEEDTLRQFSSVSSYTAAVADAAVTAARDLRAKAIMVFTMSGATARFVSQRRPSSPIHAMTPDEKTYRQLSLAWGVQPHKHELASNTDELMLNAEEHLLSEGVIAEGDTIVIVAGTMMLRGATDMLKIRKVGE